MRHVVRRAAEARYEKPAEQRDSRGFARWCIVDEAIDGAVHTGFGICLLEAGGRVGAGVSSYEESFFVLDGSPLLWTPARTVRLLPGDYGLLPVGLEHAWSGAGRWAQMRAPQPRARYGYDTYPMPAAGAPGSGIDVDVRDPRNLLFGHIEPSNMDAGRQSQEMLARSASMRTALLVYSGITVKMMVDSDLGAQLSAMFMVQYQPEGVAGSHDHPFEETYLILEGLVDATFDGTRYRLEAGDVAWAGVGCVHSFTNPGSGPVRWLETQAPMPPARHSYRFTRDWEYLKE